MIDLYATLPHYLDHLVPVWWALEPAERGAVYLGEGVHGEASRWGFGEATMGEPPPNETVTLVAGYRDHQHARRPTILVEHGAGQTYPADPRSARNPSYSGGDGYDRCSLFLSPSETVAARWRRRYMAPAVAVGCPKLDAWHARDRAPDARARDTTVAFTWHWDCRLVPETSTAWGHYAPYLARIADTQRAVARRVIGHGHPRLASAMVDTYKAAGIELVTDARIMEEADVLCADNTSLLPEFASTGRPVVWLNAPQYRRSVHHGGRFWQWPEGQPSADDADEVPIAIDRALERRPEDEKARERMVEAVYAYLDGGAARRAAEAIREEMIRCRC